MSNRDSEPIYVYDIRRKGVIYLATWMSPLLAIVIILLIASWNSPSLRNTGIIGVLIIVCIILAFAFYVYWTGRRVEFYESFVRLFPRMKKTGIDVKYSELKISWKLDNNGHTRCILTIIDNIDENSHQQQLQRSWHAYNVNGKNKDMTLFMWLQSKTGTA